VGEKGERLEKKVVLPVGELKTLLCPANPNTRGTNLPPFTHYVGVAGVGADAATLVKGEPRAGIFGYDRRTKREDIKDTSNTLHLIETATANGPWTAGGHATVRGLDPEGPPYLGRGGQFSSGHGLTQATLADGSVRPISPAVSRRVLEALATVTARDNVDLDW